MAREKFVTAYDAKHSDLPRTATTRQTLVIGDDDWPFPIPMVRQGRRVAGSTREPGSTRFFAAASAATSFPRFKSASLMSRRRMNMRCSIPDGLGQHVYAQRIVSSPGKKDGLYWPTAEREEPSPLGDLAAQASAEGYKVGQRPIPYHGYYYRILKRQGAERLRRRLRLSGQRQDDRRLCAAGLPGRIRQFWHHDLHGQSRRHGVPEGSRPTHQQDRQ